jgi:hypothetical protein
MRVSQPAELGILDWMDRVQHEPPPKNYHHAGEIQAALDKHPELVTKLSQVFVSAIECSSHTNGGGGIEAICSVWAMGFEMGLGFCKSGGRR